MSIKRLFLFFPLLIPFNGIAAEKLTIYRWVDEHNIVHFSQHQPEHEDYTQLSMANNKKSAAPVNDNSPIDASIPKNVNLANNSDISSDKCKTAQQNLKTLQDFDKIQYKDEEGNIQVLSDLAKKQQLAMNTTQVEVYCTN